MSLKWGRVRIEHQDRPIAAMPGKYIEPAPLVVWLLAKESIACQDPVERGTERERPHAGNNPVLIRHPLAAERNQRG
jgi:hypothetical protein